MRYIYLLLTCALLACVSEPEPTAPTFEVACTGLTCTFTSSDAAWQQWQFAKDGVLDNFIDGNPVTMTFREPGLWHVTVIQRSKGGVESVQDSTIVVG